jgi:hypothetical protein
VGLLAAEAAFQNSETPLLIWHFHYHVPKGTLDGGVSPLILPFYRTYGTAA